MLKEELRSRYLKKIKPRLGETFIDYLIEKEYLDQKNENILINGFKVNLDDKYTGIKNKIIKAYNEAEFQPPKKEDIPGLIKEKPDETQEVFLYLLASNDIIRINEEVYLTRDKYEESLKLLGDLSNRKKEIILGDFRDMLNTNRKIAISLLEYYDQEKITKRENDIRFLNKWAD